MQILDDLTRPVAGGFFAESSCNVKAPASGKGVMIPSESDADTF